MKTSLFDSENSWNLIDELDSSSNDRPKDPSSSEESCCSVETV